MKGRHMISRLELFVIACLCVAAAFFIYAFLA
jgi:hypothetical protein